jgi:hypothetical protein
MEFTFFEGKGYTKEACDQIQDQQNSDFKSVWSDLHEDIAMVCLCGNHGEQNLCVVCLLTLLNYFQI